MKPWGVSWIMSGVWNNSRSKTATRLLKQLCHSQFDQSSSLVYRLFCGAILSPLFLL